MKTGKLFETGRRILVFNVIRLMEEVTELDMVHEQFVVRIRKEMVMDLKEWTSSVFT
jgi:hypothetical protein